MKQQTLATIITMATMSVFPQAQGNAQSDEPVERSIEGVWLVRTTPRDCITGVPFPQAAFEGLFTFHKDGTMSVWVQNASITVTRSPSQGLWQRESGWSGYSLGFVHLRYDASGFYTGSQIATGTLVLGESGDEFTTDSSIRVLDANGNPVGGGCAGAVGTRFELEQ